MCVSAVNLIIKSKPVNWKTITGGYLVNWIVGMCASCTTVIVYFDVNLHTGAAIAPSEYHNLKNEDGL